LIACSFSAWASCSSNRWKDPYAEYFTPAVRVYFDTGDDEPDELDVFKDGSLSPAVDFLALTWPYLAHEGKGQQELAKVLGAEKDRLQSFENAETAAETAARTFTPTGPANAAEVARDKELDRDAMLAKLDRERQQQRVETVEKKSQRKDGTKLDGDWMLGPRIALGMTSPADDSETGEDSSGAPVVYISGGLVADFQKGGEVAEEKDGFAVRVEFGYMYGVSSDESLADADDSAVFVGMTVKL
jgi:hypothetical protein